jgi:zinc protease
MKDVAKFKEGELADFRKTKKIDTGYQHRSYINGYTEDVLKFEEMVNAVTAGFKTLQKQYLQKIKLLEY